MDSRDSRESEGRGAAGQPRRFGMTQADKQRLQERIEVDVDSPQLEETVGDDDARSSDDLCCAHDGTEVALVGNVVEHDDEGIALPCLAEDIGKTGVLEGTGPHHDALMGAVR